MQGVRQEDFFKKNVLKIGAASAQTRQLKPLSFSKGRWRGTAGMNIRHYSLIRLPSRIKRASRHVPLISILDQ